MVILEQDQCFLLLLSQIQLGQAKLKVSDSADVMSAMFEHCISKQGDYIEKLSSLESDNQRLIAERASALKVRNITFVFKAFQIIPQFILKSAAGSDNCSLVR